MTDFRTVVKKLSRESVLWTCSIISNSESSGKTGSQNKAVPFALLSPGSRNSLERIREK